jgi:hypothetical protein
MEDNQVHLGFPLNNYPNLSDALERLILFLYSVENRVVPSQNKKTLSQQEIFGPNLRLTKTGNFGTTGNLMNVKIKLKIDKMEYFNNKHEKLGYLTFDVTFNKGLYYQGELQGSERIAANKLLPFYKSRCPTYNLYNCLDSKDGKPWTFNFVEDLYRD